VQQLEKNVERVSRKWDVLPWPSYRIYIIVACVFKRRVFKNVQQSYS
jgi:hypothetical protein